MFLVPEGPVIITPLLDLEAWDGANCTFTCRLAAPKAASVHWYHNGKEIPDSDDDYDQKYDGETASLEICEVYPDDGGEYSCVVKHGFCFAETRASLTVTG